MGPADNGFQPTGEIDMSKRLARTSRWSLTLARSVGPGHANSLTLYRERGARIDAGTVRGRGDLTPIAMGTRPNRPGDAAGDGQSAADMGAQPARWISDVGPASTDSTPPSSSPR
jgi:hypothetical protein